MLSSADFIEELAFLGIEHQEQHQANSEDEIIELDTPEKMMGIFKQHNDIMAQSHN